MITMSQPSLAAVPSLVRLSPSSPREARLIETLVAKLRAKDDAVMDRVLRELFPEVRRWMFRQLGHHGELEDAVQDALSEIARSLYRFEGRSSLMTLARRIALRTAYRYYGRRRAEPTVAEPIEGVDTEARAAARMALARLYVALDRLPHRRRAVFVLCAIEGLEPNEAAEVLGVSANAARSLLCRARAQLERALADDDELGGAA